MHCISTYPMKPEDANLETINELKNKFKQGRLHVMSPDWQFLMLRLATEFHLLKTYYTG